MPRGCDQIYRAVVVRIGTHGSKTRPTSLQRQIGGHFRKSAVAVVAKHDVRARNFSRLRIER